MASSTSSSAHEGVSDGSVDSYTTVTYPENKKATLGTVDIVIIVVYLVATLCIGIWASLRGARKSIQRYFLAGRDMFWLPIGASVFVSNIGAAHFVGLAGTGAASGIAVTSYEWISIFLILQLGWLFLPIYLRCKVFTMPEYIYKRFGGTRLRVTLSVISLLMYILTKIAVDLYAGALFIQEAFKINLYLAIISLLVITAIYTILGGLKAVIYTDTMQTFVMIAGGIMLTVVGFSKIGGYSNLEPLYMQAIPQTTLDILAAGNATTCGIPRADSFHIIRNPVNSDLPWPGMFIGIYLIGTYYWCTDQVMVQRTLAAKSLNHAQAGCVLAGVFKILPMFIMVMTGMISRVLFPNEVGCADPVECEKICGNPHGCSNIAYPKLVLEVLPNGLRGIMLAAVLAALMSSLTSIFNSTSTIFTIDVWKRIRKSATERELLIVGMATVCVLVLISIAWVPVLLSSAGGQLFIYINMTLAPIGPPVTALYLLALLWPRVNEQGAFWGLLGGLAAGVIRLILEFMYLAPTCGKEDTRPAILTKVNYLHFSPIVFMISVIIMLLVSYATKPLPRQQLVNTTWFTMINETTHENNGGGDKEEVEKYELSTKVDKEAKQSEIKVEEVDGLMPHSGEEKTSNLGNDETPSPANKVKPSKFKWKYVVNGFAVCLSVVVAFLLGFYA